MEVRKWISFLFIQKITVFILILPTKFAEAASSTNLRAAKKKNVEEENHPLLGDYRLVQVNDFLGNDVHIPGDYLLHIYNKQTLVQGNVKNAVSLGETFTFRIDIKIGNLIGGSLTVSMPSKTIDYAWEKRFGAGVTQLFSTGIMVPDELSKIEQGLDRILPSTYSIALFQNALTFYGSMGVVVFHRNSY